jgi:hypothetical protein
VEKRFSPSPTYRNDDESDDASALILRNINLVVDHTDEIDDLRYAITSIVGIVTGRVIGLGLTQAISYWKTPFLA